uniref:Low density lipoprotein receptor adapter protein 1-B-like n=1 Tax=Sinocyclocheilus anshuiensis TaxID=1608454 RepID=A0A671KSM7_9TELE
MFLAMLASYLPENWTDTRETLLEGMVFQLKYLGMTLVEEPKGEELSAAAVKRIVATAKAGGKKLQKVTLKVSPLGIILYESVSNQLIENVSIYRISYCTADKMHDKVFAYIAQSQRNETLECHAYLCTKRKVVSVSFRVAFEFWQAAKEGISCLSFFRFLLSLCLLKMLRFNSFSLCVFLPRLAESRTNPQMLDIGVNPQDYNPEECLSPSNWDKADAEATDAEDAFGF